MYMSLRLLLGCRFKYYNEVKAMVGLSSVTPWSICAGVSQGLNSKGLGGLGPWQVLRHHLGAGFGFHLPELRGKLGKRA